MPSAHHSFIHFIHTPVLDLLINQSLSHLPTPVSTSLISPFSFVICQIVIVHSRLPSSLPDTYLFHLPACPFPDYFPLDLWDLPSNLLDLLPCLDFICHHDFHPSIFSDFGSCEICVACQEACLITISCYCCSLFAFVLACLALRSSCSTCFFPYRNHDREVKAYEPRCSSTCVCKVTVHFLVYDTPVLHEQ